MLKEGVIVSNFHCAHTFSDFEESRTLNIKFNQNDPRKRKFQYSC